LQWLRPTRTRKGTRYALAQDIAETLSRLGDERFANGIRRLFDSCIALLDRRAARPDFPVNILCGDDYEGLQPLLHEFPLPCYFQGSTIMAWHEDTILRDFAEDLLMMEHAMRILIYGPQTGAECPLAASPSCDAPKSALCSTAPWRVGVADDGLVCAFGSAMATFGLFGKPLSRA
jgi:hypothetical protein